MSLPYQTKESFMHQRKKVEKLCIERFGKKHEYKYNSITKRKTDNHGNWEFISYSYQVAFRYEKDLVVFLLAACHLSDAPKENDWIHRILR